MRPTVRRRPQSARVVRRRQQKRFNGPTYHRRRISIEPSVACREQFSGTVMQPEPRLVVHASQLAKSNGRALQCHPQGGPVTPGPVDLSKGSSGIKQMPRRSSARGHSKCKTCSTPSVVPLVPLHSACIDSGSRPSTAATVTVTVTANRSHSTPGLADVLFSTHGPEVPERVPSVAPHRERQDRMNSDTANSASFSTRPSTPQHTRQHSVVAGFRATRPQTARRAGRNKACVAQQQCFIPEEMFKERARPQNTRRGVKPKSQMRSPGPGPGRGPSPESDATSARSPDAFGIAMNSRSKLVHSDFVRAKPINAIESMLGRNSGRERLRSNTSTLNTDLSRAVAAGNLVGVLHELHKYQDKDPNWLRTYINARDRNGATALHHASLRGDEAICKVLLQAGADPSIETLHKSSCSDLAVEHGFHQLVSLYWMYGCGEDGTHDTLPTSFMGEPMPLALVRLFRAVRACDIELVCQIFKHYHVRENNCPINLNEFDKHGWNLLHYASWHGNLDIIDLLLSAGLDPAAPTRCGAGMNSIEWATSQLQWPAVVHLCKHLNAKFEWASSSLELSQQLQVQKYADQLLFRVCSRDHEGVHALIAHCIEHLGPDVPISAVANCACTRAELIPIQMAVVNNDATMCEILLAKAQADPSLVDTNGIAPVSHAVEKNSLACTLALVRHGAKLEMQSLIHLYEAGAEHGNRAKQQFVLQLLDNFQWRQLMTHVVQYDFLYALARSTLNRVHCQRILSHFSPQQWHSDQKSSSTDTVLDTAKIITKDVVRVMEIRNGLPEQPQSMNRAWHLSVHRRRSRNDMVQQRASSTNLSKAADSATSTHNLYELLGDARYQKLLWILDDIQQQRKSGQVNTFDLDVALRSNPYLKQYITGSDCSDTADAVALQQPTMSDNNLEIESESKDISITTDDWYQAWCELAANDGLDKVKLFMTQYDVLTETAASASHQPRPPSRPVRHGRAFVGVQLKKRKGSLKHHYNRRTVHSKAHRKRSVYK
jgi:ankyrin repeat protein